MSTRPPFLALTTGLVPGSVSTCLSVLGAHTVHIPADRLSAELRRGVDSVLEAEVIVINAESGGDALVQYPGLNIAAEIRALPYSAKMPTGVPWNALPIVLECRDQVLGERLRYEPGFSNVTTCAIVDGIEACYAHIATRAINFSLRVMNDMESVGWKIAYKDGRYYRVTFEVAPKRFGARELATPLYDAGADFYFSLSAIGKRMYRAVASDHTAIACDLEKHHELIKTKGLPESSHQYFIEERAHVVGAARHELIPQLKLYRADGQSIPVDFAVVPIPEFATKTPQFIELKTPDMELMSGRNPHRAILSQPVQKALGQVRDYKRTAMAGDGRLPQRYYSLNASELSLTVVAGMAGRYDKNILNRERAESSNVTLTGYDELHERFERTHTQSADNLFAFTAPTLELSLGRRTKRTDGTTIRGNAPPRRGFLR